MDKQQIETIINNFLAKIPEGHYLYRTNNDWRIMRDSGEEFETEPQLVLTALTPVRAILNLGDLHFCPYEIRYTKSPITGAFELFTIYQLQHSDAPEVIASGNMKDYQMGSLSALIVHCNESHSELRREDIARRYTGSNY